MSLMYGLSLPFRLNSVKRRTFGTMASFPFYVCLPGLICDIVTKNLKENLKTYCKL